MAMYINEECVNCGACEPECPREAISEGDDIYMRDNLDLSYLSEQVLPDGQPMFDARELNHMDDVQRVTTNFDASDEVMAQL